MFETLPQLTPLEIQLKLWVPKILVAIAILIATYLIAKGVQWALKKAINSLPVLSRSGTSSGEALASSVSTLAYWLVWLVGLLIAMQPLGLAQAMGPINALTNEVLIYLPRVAAAGLIFIVGFIFAKIARNVVEAALSVVNLDRLAARVGLCKPAAPVDRAEEKTACLSLVKAVGAIVFTLVIIPVAIAALEALGISSLVSPIVAVLHTVLDAVPRVLAAALLLAIAYIIAQWVRSLVGNTLESLGFNRAVGSIAPHTDTQPSQIAATIALVAIMLFAAIEAASLLSFGLVAGMLTEVTKLGGQVVFGSVIIAVGVILGRILANLVGDAIGESGLPSILKYAVIALSVAIGLRFMGLANEIVNLAFGLILGSAAVACALAFGLGGRETAHQLLQRWLRREPSAAKTDKTLPKDAGNT